MSYRISDLINDQLALYQGLRDGLVELKVAAERNNTAGKVFSGIKLQLAYAEARKEFPVIAFMGVPMGELLLGDPNDKD